MERHKQNDSGVLPYEEKEDELLMVQYAAGDENAFQVLYGRYRAKAYGYLSRRIGDLGMVDELFQKVFLKLHRSRERYEPKYPFSTWFFTICRNTVIDEFRRHARTPLKVLIEEDHLVSNPSHEERAPSEPVPAVVLSALPDRQREAVRLRYEEELDFDEIATKLNTTSENVRQLVSRGIRKLKRHFGKEK